MKRATTVEEFVRPKETMAEAVYRFLEEEVLTETNTDFAITWASERMKGIKLLGILPLPTAIVAKVLDHLLPERALAMLRELMVRKGMLLPEGVRNPFRT